MWIQILSDHLILSNHIMHLTLVPYPCPLTHQVNSEWNIGQIEQPRHPSVSHSSFVGFRSRTLAIPVSFSS